MKSFCVKGSVFKQMGIAIKNTIFDLREIANLIMRTFSCFSRFPSKCLIGLHKMMTKRPFRSRWLRHRFHRILWTNRKFELEAIRSLCHLAQNKLTASETKFEISYSVLPFLSLRSLIIIINYQIPTELLSFRTQQYIFPINLNFYKRFKSIME